MKTQNSKISLKRTFMALTITFLLWPIISNGQKNVEKYLEKLPYGLQLKEEKPQKYLLTENMVQQDIKGNVIQKFLITGEYTRGSNNGKVSWNNVRISIGQGNQEPASNGNLVNCMENLSYSSPTQDVLKQSFFKNCPSTENINLLRTLPGSTVRFETLGWLYFDSLQLNKPFQMKSLKGYPVEIENWGSLKFNKLTLTWTGISKMNHKLCALILLQSDYIPFETKENAMEINGSLIFNGTIWISLEDKQIEYATMNEASAIDVLVPGNPSKHTLTLLNDIKMEKLR